jgi:hypothetical protein
LSVDFNRCELDKGRKFEEPFIGNGTVEKEIELS